MRVLSWCSALALLVLFAGLVLFATAWQCMWPGGLRIRRAKDIASDQVGLLNKGDRVQGRREGDWLALLDGSGYSLIAQSRAPLTCS